MGPVVAVHRTLAAVLAAGFNFLDSNQSQPGGAVLNLAKGWHDQGVAAEYLALHTNDVTLDYSGSLVLNMYGFS